MKNIIRQSKLKNKYQFMWSVLNVYKRTKGEIRSHISPLSSILILAFI